MKTKPIIFSAPMIRALLDGRKSQTRRILKPQPEARDVRLAGVSDGRACFTLCYDGGANYTLYEPLPYTPGQLLWVREAWADVNTECGPAWAYRADGGVVQPDFDGPDFGAGPSFSYDKYPGDYTMWVTDLFDGAPDHRWHSPIHMPRWASRLTLEVTAVRVQRVQDISEEDAIAEGMTFPDGMQWGNDPVDAFRGIWNSLHGPGAWAKNPWCCAISFRTHHKNIDALLAERKAA